MNRSQVNLQDTFLNRVRRENITVTIFLVGGYKLTGVVRGFDAFTVLLDSPGKATQLIYKHSVTSVVPMRPVPNIYQEALREAGHLPPQETTVPPGGSESQSANSAATPAADGAAPAESEEKATAES
jgi:host factor-I protein